VSFEFFYQAVAGMYNYALVIRQASNRDVVTHIWSSMKLIVVGVCKSEFKVPCFAVVCIGNGHMQVVWYLLWLKVEDMVWKFLCYGEVWRWSTAAVNHDYLKISMIFLYFMVYWERWTSLSGYLLCYEWFCVKYFKLHSWSWTFCGQLTQMVTKHCALFPYFPCI